MAVESIEALMIAIQTLYPVTYSDKQIPMVTERYRTALAGINGRQLDDAWNKLALVWTKRTAPTAADILAAAGRTAGASNSNGPTTTGSFKARLEAKDARRNEDRRNLIDAYERNHAPGYAMARAEGWIGQLETQVKRAANIISQRNEQRRAFMSVPDWRPEASEDNRSESFVPWCSIVTHEGLDLIEIDQGTLKVWRAQAAIPGPGMKPIKQTAVQSVGFQSMETSSAA